MNFDALPALQYGVKLGGGWRLDCWGDMGAPGLPTEAEYVAAYCKRTGRDGIEGWEFYLAFGLFRLASISQGVYRRVLDGSIASDFPPVSQAPTLAAQALEILSGG